MHPDLSSDQITPVLVQTLSQLEEGSCRPLPLDQLTRPIGTMDCSRSSPPPIQEPIIDMIEQSQLSTRSISHSRDWHGQTLEPLFTQKNCPKMVCDHNGRYGDNKLTKKDSIGSKAKNTNVPQCLIQDRPPFTWWAWYSRPNLVFLGTSLRYM